MKINKFDRTRADTMEGRSHIAGGLLLSFIISATWRFIIRVKLKNLILYVRLHYCFFSSHSSINDRIRNLDRNVEDGIPSRPEDVL